MEAQWFHKYLGLNPRSTLYKLPDLQPTCQRSILNLLFCKKRITKVVALPWLVWHSWLSIILVDQKVVGLIPSQGTCLGYGPPDQCFSPSLPLSPSKERERKRERERERERKDKKQRKKEKVAY